MKKMHSEGSTSVSIAPCYDGRTLKDVQKVAKDGLSVISIKQGHRNCKFTIDPKTKLPLISCAQGIKARNSFWNLHKPDLRKVRGLECSTTESVTQLLRAHNVDNAGKPTQRRKILRLLESIVTKKSKSSSNPEVLKDQSFWPVNKSVLSSLCQETEMKENGMVGTQDLSDQQELPLSQKPRSTEKLTSDLMIIEEHFDCYNDKDCLNNVVQEHSSSPQTDSSSTNNDPKVPVKIVENDDKTELFDITPLKHFGSKTNVCNPSPFNIITKLSLAKMSVSSETLLVPEQSQCLLKTVDSETSEISTNERVISTEIQHVSEENVEKDDTGSVEKVSNVTAPFEGSASPSATASHPTLNQMFKEMKQIEDYISLHISPESDSDSKQKNNLVAGKNQSKIQTSFNQLFPGNINVNYQVNRNSETELKSKETKTENDALSQLPQENIDETSNISNIEDPFIGYCIWEYPIEADDLESKTSRISRILSCQESESDASSLRLTLINDKKATKFKRRSSIEDPLLSYCSWEDSVEIEKVTSTNPCSGAARNFFTPTNTLVPVDFFQQVWRECFHECKLKTDLNELNQTHNSFDAMAVPCYYDSFANTYDNSLLEEAYSIVHTIDLFLDDTFLHDVDTSTFNYIPCTIVEINDDDDLNISNWNNVDKVEPHSVENNIEESTDYNRKNHLNGDKAICFGENLERDDTSSKERDGENKNSALMAKDCSCESTGKPTTKCDHKNMTDSLDSDHVLNTTLKTDKTVKETEVNLGSPRGVSRFVHVSKNCDLNSQASAQKYLFSTSNIKLNLTNPLQK